MLSGTGSKVLDRARCCAPLMHAQSVAPALDFVFVKAPRQHSWTAPERQRLCMCVRVCVYLPPSFHLPPPASPPSLQSLLDLFPPPLPFCVHVCRVWILVCV